MAEDKTMRVRYKYESTDTDQLNILFAGVLRREDITDPILKKEHTDNIARFKSIFSSNVFQDEYAVLYELIVRSRMTTGKWDLMESVIDENREIIMYAPQIYMGSFKSDYTVSDIYSAFLSATQRIFEDVCDTPFTGTEGFNTVCNGFIETFEKKYLRSVLKWMSMILSSPEPYFCYRGGRRKEFIGYSGAMDFLTMEKERLESLRSAQRARQFVLDENWLWGQIDPKEKAAHDMRTEKLFSFGMPEIDAVWAGFRRSHFIGIMGPPKGGKTSLSAFAVYRAWQAGKKVAVWAMEGSAQESWIHKLMSAYIYDYHGLEISPSTIRDGLSTLTKDERTLIEEARFSLVKNNSISFIEETGYAEDFLDVIEGHYKVYNKFDVLVVDSLLNLQTRTGRRKTEYLSSAYIALKDWVAHRLDIAPCCIVTAQIKQEAIKTARGQVEPEFDETSGGETAETIRTPDEVIAIFGTKAQYAIGRTSLHHVASRNSKKFETFDVDANFGVGFFKSIGC